MAVGNGLAELVCFCAAVVKWLAGFTEGFARVGLTAVWVILFGAVVGFAGLVGGGGAWGGGD
ncbi:hypothetical protein B0H11DRAFT_1995254 [Mycena galericulata]|nr:hypothetical protein B0H11DRAFT_1995254 [Mycena galericulata]